MDFSDALKHVKAGKVAWRKSWAVDQELHAFRGTLIKVRAKGTGVWLPNQDDLFATDWDSGPEPRPKQSCVEFAR